MTTNNKKGKYHYSRHYNLFGVWVCDYDGGNGTGSYSHIKDFQTHEEARLFVWKMNGWGTPKTALAN